MPDQWGRPTFDDGARLAQGLMTVQAWQQQQQDRQTEKDAYAVADALEAGDDISVFSDEAKYKGAKLKFDKDLQTLKKQAEELLVSNEGRRQKLLEFQEIDAKGKRYMAQYQAALRSGDEKAAKKIAHKFNNEVAYNGIYIPEEEAVDLDMGKISIIRNATGQREEIDAPTIEQYTQMLAGYFNVPQEEMRKRMITGDQYRREHNLKLIAKASDKENILINDKGNIIHRVPAGTWDKKNSEVRGAFYIDNPISQNEIPAEVAKNYKPLFVAKAQKELSKKDVVDPKKLVTGKGAEGKQQQGLIVQGAQGPEFQTVAGAPSQGLDTSGIVDPSKAKSAYELRVKQLNTVLMPFNKTEAPIFEKRPDGNYQLAEGGHNALNAAWKLLERGRRDPSALSPQEAQLYPYAKQAIQMYKQISGANAQSFGQPVQSGKIRMTYDRNSGRLIAQ